MKRFSSHLIGIQQGSRMMFTDYVDDGPMWTGDGPRESRHIVDFSESFREAPAVMASIGLWDVDQTTNTRADLITENITARGFHLVFRTWGDTRIARLRADWTAIGPLHDAEQWNVD